MCRRFSYENAQRLNKLEKALLVFNQWTSNEYAEFIERLASKERFNTYFNDNIYTEEMLQKHAKTFQDTGIKDAEPLLESIAQIYKG